MLQVASGGVIFSTIQKFQPDEGNVTGKKVVYGFAKYMCDALPNATYLGFTGTPIESTDTNTSAVFGNYIDVYDIAQAVEDGATVCIYYEYAKSQGKMDAVRSVNR